MNADEGPAAEFGQGGCMGASGLAELRACYRFRCLTNLVFLSIQGIPCTNH